MMRGAEPAEINHQSRNVLADQGFTFWAMSLHREDAWIESGVKQKKANEASSQADDVRFQTTDSKGLISILKDTKNKPCGINNVQDGRDFSPSTSTTAEWTAQPGCP